MYDFKCVLNESCVKLAGFGGSVNAARSFCFVRRASLDVSQFGEPESEFAEAPNPNDVCLLVRRYLHVAELSQAPIVVLPASRASRVRNALASIGVLPRLGYSPKQQSDLEKTASVLCQFPFRLERAAVYLRKLAAGKTHEGVAVPSAPSVLCVRPSDPQPMVAWVAPTNLIEPPAAIKIVSAKPVASKKQLEGKRKRDLHGRMKPVRGGCEPKGLDVVHGIVGLPEVGAYGDIAVT